MTRTLRQQQSLFAKFLGQLLVYIYMMDGWEATMGDVYRPDHLGHAPNSTHYIRLAADVNLFVDGVWKDADCPEWQVLGKFWEALDQDARWGGRFKQVDLNHFSMEWGGTA
jgi:D-alanyl-D-alanine carboxypeptidase